MCAKARARAEFALVMRKKRRSLRLHSTVQEISAIQGNTAHCDAGSAVAVSAVSDEDRARFIRAIRWLNDPQSYLAHCRGGPGQAPPRRSRGALPWATCVRVVTAAPLATGG